MSKKIELYRVMGQLMGQSNVELISVNHIINIAREHSLVTLTCCCGEGTHKNEIFVRKSHKGTCNFS